MHAELPLYEVEAYSVDGKQAVIRYVDSGERLTVRQRDLHMHRRGVFIRTSAPPTNIEEF